MAISLYVLLNSHVNGKLSVRLSSMMDLDVSRINCVLKLEVLETQSNLKDTIDNRLLP